MIPLTTLAVGGKIDVGKRRRVAKLRVVAPTGKDVSHNQRTLRITHHDDFRVGALVSIALDLPGAVGEALPVAVGAGLLGRRVDDVLVVAVRELCEQNVNKGAETAWVAFSRASGYNVVNMVTCRV